ncbi:hypothetical protein GF718_12600 [Citrobacter braakii]|uniref:hypothetical protein n=1 Tax=Citrobacter TaxID=544 RepID=UPI0015E9F9CB|nr:MULTISPECIES: hypothetical protein [Citrobacter]MBM3062163.1 hypothetical protein [Citrobacter braakii]MBM3066698.1 hypothetical protein [Citrobacter braakii]QLS55595.1 hypothetical protein HV314_16240 [Citrobacter sp. RHBSTW-00887]WBU72664.1 hypothetical protein PGH06_21260 [Citrobacter braakii]
MDFNATTGVICGGVGGASSYLWIANVKSGVKKTLFPSRDVYSSFAPVSNVIISSSNGQCIFTDGHNIYSYSMKTPISRIMFSGAANNAAEKTHRVFFDDKNNITIALFDKHFSLLSKSMKGNNLTAVRFPKNINYSLKALGDFASLSDNGDTLYTTASVEDNDGYGFSAILSINVQSGNVKSILLPYLDGLKYKVKQFYIVDGGHKIAMLLEGKAKPAWYVYTANAASGNNSENSSDNYKLLFNKYDAGLEVVQHPAGDDYFYSVTTDKGDLIKINLSGDFNVTSFDVKGEMDRAGTVAHGDASYPFVEPKLSSPKKGSAVKVLGDFMVCKDLNNSPDENNCGLARSGVDALVQEIRTIESQQFVKISPEKDPNLVFWTLIENVQSVN